MSKTLGNTATAQHIAKQHGLTFSYDRSGRVWRLAARHHVAGMRDSLYRPAEIADFDTDTFYWHCMEVAAHTITPAQMAIVVIRAQYSEMQDRLNNGEQFAPNTPDALEFVRLAVAAECNDKQVHSMEDSIYHMRTDAEEASGTYGEHKTACADVVAIASYGKGKFVGVSIGGRFVLSLPARLNGGRIPDLDDVAAILAGASVAEGMTAFNVAAVAALAARMNAECLDWLPLPYAPDHSFVLLAELDGIYIVDECGARAKRVADSWLTTHDVAPRVNLTKPAAPLHVASVAVFPPESNASVFERVAASLRARRLQTVPAVYVDEFHAEHVELLPPPPDVVHVDPSLCASCVMPEPGNPCDKCGACLHADQSGVCDDCRQDEPEMTNYYQCPRCEHEWQDVWTCAADDDCPNCGARHITPYDSEEVAA